MNEQRLRNWRVLPTLSISEAVTVSGLKRGQIDGLIKQEKLEVAHEIEYPKMIRTRSLIAFLEPEETAPLPRVPDDMRRELDRFRKRIA